jgi:MFS family permease
VTHFVIALALVGVGWNFMYIGGTTLLTEVYAPAERAKTQGANDFIVFAIMGISSFASGALVNAAGWEKMNAGALPVLVVLALAVAWLGWLRSRGWSRAKARTARSS